MRRLVLLAFAVACVTAFVWRRTRAPEPPAPPAAPAKSDDTARSAMRAVESKPVGAPPVAPAPAAPEPQALKRCFPGDAPGAPQRPLEALLDRAADLFEGADFEGSLACAEEAARVDPQSVEAHHERADALRELKRLAEAQDAFARALALDPDDPRTLDGAADFYVNRLTPTVDHLETGLEYARRGSRKLKRQHGPAGDRTLGSHLALLEGEALSDLGRSREALGRLDVALSLDPDNVHIVYERAVAEFELCRFEDARRDLARVLGKDPKDAAAHHELGLVLERLGDAAGADRELGRARALAPADFREPILPTVEEFRALVDAEAAKLPERLRADLGTVSLETADLPDLADLTAEEPPLSPTILGLFRGAPLGDPAADPREVRTIILYRKNLARAVASRDELVSQIRTTLLHELGHLRGEDDDDLRSRGLE